MRATAQDMDAASMMGVDIDRVIITTFFLGGAMAGAGGLIFGLYYNFTSFLIGFKAGLLRLHRRGRSGGIGNVPGAMLGGVLIGLIEAMSGSFISAAWSDVVIFSILVLVLVFRPAGLLGTHRPRSPDGAPDVRRCHPPAQPPLRRHGARTAQAACPDRHLGAAARLPLPPTTTTPTSTPWPMPAPS